MLSESVSSLYTQMILRPINWLPFPILQSIFCHLNLRVIPKHQITTELNKKLPGPEWIIHLKGGQILTGRVPD